MRRHFAFGKKITFTCADTFFKNMLTLDTLVTGMTGLLYHSVDLGFPSWSSVHGSNELRHKVIKVKMAEFTSQYPKVSWKVFSLEICSIKVVPVSTRLCCVIWRMIFKNMDCHTLGFICHHPISTHPVLIIAR